MVDKVSVRFISKWNGYNPGNNDIAGFSANKAKFLVDVGVAEYYKPKNTNNSPTDLIQDASGSSEGEGGSEQGVEDQTSTKDSIQETPKKQSGKPKSKKRPKAKAKWKT